MDATPPVIKKQVGFVLTPCFSFQIVPRYVEMGSISFLLNVILVQIQAALTIVLDLMPAIFAQEVH